MCSVLPECADAMEQCSVIPREFVPYISVHDCGVPAFPYRFFGVSSCSSSVMHPHLIWDKTTTFGLGSLTLGCLLHEASTLSSYQELPCIFIERIGIRNFMETLTTVRACVTLTIPHRNLVDRIKVNSVNKLINRRKRT
jgi:hypothetical protein